VTTDTDWHRYQKSLPWYNCTRSGVWTRMGPTIVAEVLLIEIGKWGLALAVVFAGAFYTCWWVERWDTFDRFERWKEKELRRVEAASPSE